MTTMTQPIRRGAVLWMSHSLANALYERSQPNRPGLAP
jgi:hypothetical protein